MVPVPDTQAQESIIAKFDTLVRSIENHEAWTPPKPHPTLFHIWNFVKGSQYIMTELENIRHGRPVQHPNQIPAYQEAKDDEERAQRCFFDVLTRTMTINQLLQNPNRMTMLGLAPLDIGNDIKSNSKDVEEVLMAVPE